MEQVRALGIALLVVVCLGVVFVMIYWVSLIFFPLLVLGIIGFFVFIANVSPEQKEAESEFKF